MHDLLEDEDIKFLIHLIIFDHDSADWGFFSVAEGGNICFRQITPSHCVNDSLRIHDKTFGDYHFPCGVHDGIMQSINELTTTIQHKFPEVNRISVKGFKIDSDVINMIGSWVEL